MEIRMTFGGTAESLCTYLDRASAESVGVAEREMQPVAAIARLTTAQP